MTKDIIWSVSKLGNLKRARPLKTHLNLGIHRREIGRLAADGTTVLLTNVIFTANDDCLHTLLLVESDLEHDRRRIRTQRKRRDVIDVNEVCSVTR